MRCSDDDSSSAELYSLSLHDALPILGEPVLLFPKPKHFKWLKENKVLNGVLDFKIPNKMTEIMNKVHFQGRLNQLIGNDKDRKSTRLNSSHVAISYAVFCLKKKNEIE